MAGGFKNKELNILFKKRTLEEIIEFVFLSMNHMKEICEKENIKIENKEEKIRTHLLENYLDNDNFRKNIGYEVEVFPLRFEAEVPENYNPDTESYKGRVDIKVVGLNTFLKNKKDYYIIECKRIDGTEILNKAFVKEGICRFAQEKYSSYNNENALLGFVIKDIDIISNTKKIDKIQKEQETIKVEKGFSLETRKDNDYLYSSLYRIKSGNIKLKSVFYNFSSIVK